MTLSTKLIFFACLTISLASSETAAGQTATYGAMVQHVEFGQHHAIPSDRMFVPGGFDDNDNAQVVLDGFILHSCDVLVEPLVDIDINSSSIVVSAQVERIGEVCENDLEPFSQTVNLGVLPFGKYSVATNEGGLHKTLQIFESNSAGPDDETYAYLTEAFVEYNEDVPDDESRWQVVLKGFFADACQKWDYIDVIVSERVFEVLPVMTPADPDCPQKIQVFTKHVQLPAMASAGRYLLHVRSQGGEAWNEVFTVPE